MWTMNLVLGRFSAFSVCQVLAEFVTTLCAWEFGYHLSRPPLIYCSSLLCNISTFRLMRPCGDGGESSATVSSVREAEKAIEERILKATFLKRPPPRRKLLSANEGDSSPEKASTSDAGSPSKHLVSPTVARECTSHIPTPPPSTPPSFTVSHCICMLYTGLEGTTSVYFHRTV